MTQEARQERSVPRAVATVLGGLVISTLSAVFALAGQTFLTRALEEPARVNIVSLNRSVSNLSVSEVLGVENSGDQTAANCYAFFGLTSEDGADTAHSQEFSIPQHKIVKVPLRSDSSKGVLDRDDLASVACDGTGDSQIVRVDGLNAAKGG